MDHKWLNAEIKSKKKGWGTEDRSKKEPSEGW